MQRSHSAELKAKGALEAIRERKTRAEIASAFGVHTTQIAFWKKHAIAQFAELFSSGKDKRAQAQDELVEKMYEKIGRLEMETDWLKKSAERLGYFASSLRESQWLFFLQSAEAPAGFPLQWRESLWLFLPQSARMPVA